MLEQSSLNGAVYLSLELVENGKTKLITKNAILSNIEFGPPSEIVLHQNPRTELILIEYVNENSEGYLYEKSHDKWIKVDQIKSTNQIDDTLNRYLYGMATYKDKNTTYTVPYMIQNEPPNITLDIVPNRDECIMPPTLTGYPYDQIFTYDNKLIDLIGKLTATYTDKYKRPLHPAFMKSNKYFPVALENIATTFMEISKTPKPFPIVVMLNSSTTYADFACIDLEPGYTPDELVVAESFDAYYVEDTPRGGKHYLVKPNKENTEFKYRISEHLEVQVHCLITFYGINGKFLNDNPSESSFESYTVVGHNTMSLISTEAPTDIIDIVSEVTKAVDILGTTGKIKALRVYKTEPDDSRADFTALARLYYTDIIQFKTEIPIGSLPWVLAEYASTIIPARLKHSTSRNGVPYLVYLANKIVFKGDNQHD